MEPTAAAILIPTRNRPGILADSLRHLHELGLGEFPLWVYDDASDDPKAIEAAVREHWPEAHVVHGDLQRGQAYGRNVLLRSCGAEFAILLDDDQYFLDVGPLRRYLDPATRPAQLAGVSFQCRDKADGRLDVPDWVGARKCASYMGGCILFHVPSVLAVGGYRAFWGYGYEEPELATRLFARGFYLWYDPAILVEHNHIITSIARRNEREHHFLYMRNVLMLSTMNMPIWLGLPVGIYRWARRAQDVPSYHRTKLRALLLGLSATLEHWRERSPMTVRQSLFWLRFSRTWQQAGSEPMEGFRG